MDNDNKKDKQLNPEDLPQSEVFVQKEVYQHSQPADNDVALKPKVPKEDSPIKDGLKEANKASKEEGLNQANSEATAGAFEGFEDQSKDQSKDPA